jgi:hypothetical protein
MPMTRSATVTAGIRERGTECVCCITLPDTAQSRPRDFYRRRPGCIRTCPPHESWLGLQMDYDLWIAEQRPAPRVQRAPEMAAG